MTPRLTRLNLSALSLVAWGLFLGVLSGRSELFLAAVPLLVALLAARLTILPGDYSVTHEMSADRLFEDDRLTVTVTLIARGPIPVVEALEPLPPLVELVAGRNRVVFSLKAGEQVRWSYEICCRGRGRLNLGTMHVRLLDRWGFRALETRHVDPKPVWVYPRVIPLRRLPRPFRTQTSVGNYVSPRFGEGLEPGDIRPFVPGDRIRHVNWRASLRLNRLYVTQYHQERHADVVLMLDTLSQVGTPPSTSLDFYVRAAAALAAAYLARKDRVGLINYGGVIRWVKPGSGRAQWERLLDALLQAEVVFTYVAKDLALVPRRVLPPQALVVALSPLLDARFVRATTDLAARGFDLVILAISPIELTRDSTEASPVVDLACRLWALERRAQLSELRQRGVPVLEWNPAEPLELALAQLGERRRWRRMAG